MEKDGILERFKAGTEIYGDDFSQKEINEWFADEAEGYAAIVPEHRKYSFGYELITEAILYRWFRKLGNRKWKILSYGGRVWHRTPSDFGSRIGYYHIGAG